MVHGKRLNIGCSLASVKAVFYTVGFRQSKTGLFEDGPFLLDIFSTAFYWSFYFSSVESILYFFAPLRGDWCEGVLLYGSRKSVGSSVLRAFFARNACFAHNEHSSKRVGGVWLSRKPPKLRSWLCNQPRTTKATAGVAVVGKMTLISLSAVVV